MDMDRKTYNSLKPVGYWHSAREPELPKPQPADWDEATRRLVVSYLEAGSIAASWRGWSNCRICGIHNGSRCLTDGVWRWPQGLAHCVREHSIGLPEEFVQHVRSRSDAN